MGDGATIVRKTASFSFKPPAPKQDGNRSRFLSKFPSPEALRQGDANLSLLKKSRVLLVMPRDDTNSLLAFRFLEEVQGEVAHSSAQARELAGAGGFDMVLIPLQLRDRDNGLCLARELREFLPDAKYVIMSPHASLQKLLENFNDSQGGKPLSVEFAQMSVYAEEFYSSLVTSLNGRASEIAGRFGVPIGQRKQF